MAQVIHDAGVTIVELDPAYESMQIEPLQQLGELLLNEVSQATPPRLVLDMTQTTYIDSMFIETVFRTWKRIKDRQGAMAICCPNQVCGDVLRVTKLDQIWPVCDTRDEAIQTVKAA